MRCRSWRAPVRRWCDIWTGPAEKSAAVCLLPDREGHGRLRFSCAASPLRLLDVEICTDHLLGTLALRSAPRALNLGEIDSTNSARKKEQNGNGAVPNGHVKLNLWRINSQSA